MQSKDRSRVRSGCGFQVSGFSPGIGFQNPYQVSDQISDNRPVTRNLARNLKPETRNLSLFFLLFFRFLDRLSHQIAHNPISIRSAHKRFRIIVKAWVVYQGAESARAVIDLL